MIYRNLPGDYGIDHLFTPAAGLTWLELIRIAENPAPAADAMADPAARLLLLLPLLNDLDVPDAAPVRLGGALVAVGAPQDTALNAAEHLLAHLAERSSHDPAWTSPLSGAVRSGTAPSASR
ncbi:hypothetical protein ACIQZO_10075 [Streptomyces sp. NPDC097617]|uniref:hypothetical protein n=1 Tax=Streptomyces sp. NPDC097617 TaxID=3366091 RepID=UPI003817573F